MNKEAAAAFIGISVRTLQRLVKGGKIAVRYERGPKGDEAHFDEDELRGYIERNKPVSLIRPGAAPLALATHDATDVMTSAATNGATGAATDVTARRMVAAFEALSVGNKLVLSLKEVAQLTGRSVARLREDCESGRLKAKKNEIARGWRVKRDDLDAYVKKL
jgi:hypothetical protein